MGVRVFQSIKRKMNLERTMEKEDLLGKPFDLSGKGVHILGKILTQEIVLG